MAKYLDVKNLAQLQDYVHRRYAVTLRPGETYADLFVPTFWSLHRGKLEPNDLIRVRANDGSFDVCLTVKDVPIGGVVMQRWPVEPSADQLAAAAEIGKAERYVPYANDGKPKVRVEHLPATGWRVVGLEGEIVAGLKDEPAAQKAMAQYLKDIRYAMPDAAEQEAELSKHLARVKLEEEQRTIRRERASKKMGMTI